MSSSEADSSDILACSRSSKSTYAAMAERKPLTTSTATNAARVESSSSSSIGFVAGAAAVVAPKMNGKEEKNEHNSLKETPPCSVRVGNALYTNASWINGDYYPIDEIYNDRLVYFNSSLDTYIEYWASTKCWQIKGVANRKQNLCYAYARSNADTPGHVAPESWFELNNGSYKAQKALVVARIPLPLRVTGAHALWLNGEYHRDKCNNMLYKKQDCWKIWIEYFKERYHIKSEAHLGKDKYHLCSVRTSEGADELHNTTWHGCDEKQTLETTLRLTPFVVAMPVRILGASGPHASSINGTYTATRHTCGSRAVYMKEKTEEKSKGRKEHVYALYCKDSRQWHIKPKSLLRTCLFYACAQSHAYLLEDVATGVWEESTGVQKHTFIQGEQKNQKAQTQEQTEKQTTPSMSSANEGIRVIKSARPVTISVAKSTSTYTWLTGTYRPMEEVFNERSVYKKETADVWIEYQKEVRSWQVKGGSFKYLNQAKFYIITGAKVLEDIEEHAYWFRSVVGQPSTPEHSITVTVLEEKNEHARNSYDDDDEDDVDLWS